MLDAAALRPDERLLELACGPGGVGLAAAEIVAPGGEAALSDIAPEMTAISRDRADARNSPTSAPHIPTWKGLTSPTRRSTWCCAARA